MAFKVIKSQKKQAEFVPLIDIIFILLAFFLVSIGGIQFKERLLFLPTPKRDVGRTQFMIQLIENQRVFYLDEDAVGIVSEIRERFGFLPDEQLRARILETLYNQNTISYEDCLQKIRALVDRANQNPRSQFFILIRCPDEIPFDEILIFISEFKKAKHQNLKYGCICGSIAEILEAQSIREVTEEDAQGNRTRNIYIRLTRNTL